MKYPERMLSLEAFSNTVARWGLWDRRVPSHVLGGCCLPPLQLRTKPQPRAMSRFLSARRHIACHSLCSH